MKILLFAYYWPTLGRPGIRALLSHWQLLSNTGYTVTVIIVGDGKFPYNHAEIVTRQMNKIKAYHPGNNFIDKLRLTNFFVAINLKMAAGWLGSKYNSAEEAVKYFNPDVIVTTGPLYSTHFIGIELKPLCNKKWVADIRSPWRKNSLYEALPLAAEIAERDLRFLEEIFHTADVVTASEREVKINLAATSNFALLPNTPYSHLPQMDKLAQLLAKL